MHGVSVNVDRITEEFKTASSNGNVVGRCDRQQKPPKMKGVRHSRRRVIAAAGDGHSQWHVFNSDRLTNPTA